MDIRTSDPKHEVIEDRVVSGFDYQVLSCDGMERVLLVKM